MNNPLGLSNYFISVIMLILLTTNDPTKKKPINGLAQQSKLLYIETLVGNGLIL